MLKIDQRSLQITLRAYILIKTLYLDSCQIRDGSMHHLLQDKSEKENNRSETPQVLDLVKSRNQTRCSICQKSTDENELKYCQHCNRNVCQNAWKSTLIPTVYKPTHPGKAAIILQLDEAISQLKAAVSQSLENALRKVEVLEIDGSTVLKVKVDDLLASSSDLKEVKGIYEQLEYGTIRKLEDAEKIFLHLRDVKEKARSLLDSSDPLPLLPIMQFELSNRVQENLEKLEEIDMIVGCGSVPLSSLLADHGVRIKNPVERGSSTAIISKVKLYVGGLRRTHTEEHLKRHFEIKYGPLVDCHVVKDIKTKESRGFGFVTFREAIHASRALADFPHFIEGVPIQVRPYKFANADGNKAPLGEASSRQTKQKPPRHRVVVVGISDTTTKDAIKTALSKIGPVINVDKEPNRGFATVNFEKPEAVDQAVLLSQIRINDNDCEIYPYNVGKKVIRDREGGEKGSSEDVDELRLFIGNLNPSVNRDLLKGHFSIFGNVTKVDIIYDHGSSKPRGMAFVNMSTVQEVEAVLKARPHIIDSKELIVRKAYKKNSEQSQPLKTTEASKDTTMIIYDIPVNTSRQDILECFSKFGVITSLTVQDKERNGILSFASPQALQEALKTSSHSVRGKDLRVACHQNPLANHSTESKKTLCVRVGDIAPLTTQLELRVCLAQFGGVLEASVVKTGSPESVGIERS
nr:RNA recognition motif RNP 1 [Hymenolepis microstoma]